MRPGSLVAYASRAQSRWSGYLAQLLRQFARRDGRRNCAAEDKNEVTSPHSITSSARARSVGGIVRLRAFAVAREGSAALRRRGRPALDQSIVVNRLAL